jgi:glycosyltransferase involved in cell wall biosynthesis
LVGVNITAAAIAVEFANQLPFWADVNGDPLVEGQAQAFVYGSDANLGGFRRLLLPVLRRADRLSTCSQRQRFALIGQLGIAGRLTSRTDGYEFVEPIPNSLDEDEISMLGSLKRRQRSATDPFVLLWSGGYNNWADVDTLFRALDMSMRADQRLRFVSLGGSIDGHAERTYDSFLTHVRTSPLKDRFRFEGWVPSSRLPHYYEHTDAAILVDRRNYEGLLGARTRALDWLAAGIPVIMTRLSEISESLDARGLALTARCGDVDGLAQAILRLVRDPGLARRMGQQARDYARQRLSAQLVLEPVLNWVDAPVRAPDRKGTPGRIK